MAPKGLIRLKLKFMDKKIEKIINDLYMIDGSFKKNEKVVVKVIEELLQSRPDAEVNQEFIEKLHLELAKRMEYLKAEAESRASSVGNFSFFGKLAYSLAGATLMLVFVAIGAAYVMNNDKNPSSGIAIDFAPKVEKVRDGAFGSLALDQSKAISALGRGGGGGGGSPAGKIGAPDMPNPMITNYRFVYKGGDIPVQDKALVYKRVKDLPLGEKIAEAVSSLSFGSIDLGKFSNTRMVSLGITEDRDFGYDVYLDFREGAISVYAGTKWPDPNAGCSDEACFEKNRLKESDVPKDDELIAIANKFLEDYKIDRSAYGEPSVVRDYEWYKGSGLIETAIYIPETIPVTYPLKIDGQTVYDDAAVPAGMTIDISIRQKKVFGIRSINTQKYESSNYEAEQDKSKIVSIAENGGMYGNFKSPEANQTIDIELGTPEIKLISTWNYNPEKRTTDSLFVPSYVFPVIKVQDGSSYYRKNIVVPMPKEMIERINQSASINSGALLKK